MSIYAGIDGVVKAFNAIGVGIDDIMRCPNYVQAGVDGVVHNIWSRLEDAEPSYFYLIPITYWHRDSSSSDYIEDTKTSFSNYGEVYYKLSPSGNWGLYLKTKIASKGAGIIVHFKFCASPKIGTRGNFCSYGNRFTSETPFLYTIRNLTSSNVSGDNCWGYVYTRFNGETSMRRLSYGSSILMQYLTKSESGRSSEFELMALTQTDDAAPYKVAAATFPTEIKFNGVTYPFNIVGVEKR